MPSIAERTIVRDHDSPRLVAPEPTDAPSPSPRTIFSLPGNPAPHRGIVPTEYMYDFHTDHFNPDGPYFTRGFADTNTYLHNLALLALSKTTKIL